jgi:signal transduction histidine kinase
MTARWREKSLAAATLLAIVWVALLVYHSLAWIDRPFPGFLLLANRVVPSVALPEWTAAPALFQSQVIAVDGAPVERATDVYARVAEQPVGTIIDYAFRGRDGSLHKARVPSRQFSRADYVFFFGSFLLSGGAFLGAGLLVAWTRRGNPAATALLCTGASIGLFALTALDLYGPYWFFRLHIIGEILVGPAFLHLALVFPTDRLGKRRHLVIASIYLSVAPLAVLYESVLWSPRLYSLVHLAATALQAVGGIAIIAAVLFDLVTTRSPLVRRRLAIVGLGTAAGFLVPTVLMAGSGLLGGSIAVNGAALTAFFFPLSLAYAILKEDLFEIDLVLRRAISYGVVVFLIGVVYFLILYAFGVFIPGQLSSWSPVALACLNLGLLLLLAPVRDRVQGGINRVFYRSGYQVDQALAALSSALTSAHSLGDVSQRTGEALAATCAPRSTSLLFVEPTGVARELSVNGTSREMCTIDPEVHELLAHGKIASRYSWDERGAEGMAVWTALDAEILVPIHSGGKLLACLRLSGKESGRPYGAYDSIFLQSAAPQIALALDNAIAYSDLAELNVNLEGMVQDRTKELHRSNAELNLSLGRLRDAYGKLEQSQASLLRADRLATLGKLTAGIAHEMNTPLGAVMNALKLVQDLGEEYEASIDDDAVPPTAHHEIAAEIIQTASAAAQWTRKAASFISSVKAQGRETRPSVADRIVVSDVASEVRDLLLHRLRAGSCALEFSATPADVAVIGDGGRLGQVLLNLCSNAIDAYEDAGKDDGRIEIVATQREGHVTITVRDWAGGIPPDVLPRIFEELYTTKGPGRGTGQSDRAGIRRRGRGQDGA